LITVVERELTRRKSGIVLGEYCDVVWGNLFGCSAIPCFVIEIGVSPYLSCAVNFLSSKANKMNGWKRGKWLA
jgi:hypothetical protein